MATSIEVRGFRVGERKRIVDRGEFTKSDGSVDHIRLIKKFDEIGEKIFNESKVLRRI
jgi:bacillopeptidase F (M6 metalloprotease family)